MVEVMVSGSRSWTDKDAVRRELKAWYEAVDRPDSVTLVHGAARGADTLAHEVASEFGWTRVACPAQWEREGRRAGILRNLRMLDRQPAHVFIFWDGQSRGTKHVIDEVQRRKQSYSICL